MFQPDGPLRRTVFRVGSLVLGALGISALVAAVAGFTMHPHPSGMSMSTQMMQEMSRRWFAAHPVTGERSQQTAAVNVKVTNFRFDADNNAATQLDTIKILVGQTVQWNWVTGTHTVTSGTGSFDPQAGVLFNQQSNVTTPTFSFTFNTPGMVPYFCGFHEGSNMFGWVRVTTTTDVEPGIDARAGFVVAPSPNPTRSEVSFQYAIRTSGRVRLEVFDTRGRRVTTLVDRDMPAGTYPMTWSGVGSKGTGPGPGVYYVRLHGPGIDQSRRFVIVE